MKWYRLVATLCSVRSSGQSNHRQVAGTPEGKNMSPNVTDSELVIRAKAGDHSAFTQFYERYAPAIYRYIYFRIGEPELAEDLQAEVFLRMLEGINRYED